MNRVPRKIDSRYKIFPRKQCSRPKAPVDGMFARSQMWPLPLSAPYRSQEGVCSFTPLLRGQIYVNCTRK